MSTITSQSDLTEEEKERIQSVIREFLAHASPDELYETRIQKLIFFTEVYCVLRYRRRLTHAEYRPYMYGAFSRDVRDALESMDDIRKRKTVIHGNRTTAYSLDDLDDYESPLNGGIERIIETVWEAVKDESTEDLAQFSKKSWLFEKTEYDHPMQFIEFNEALRENPEIRSALKRQMPQKVKDVNEEESLLSLAR